MLCSGPAFGLGQGPGIAYARPRGRHESGQLGRVGGGDTLSIDPIIVTPLVALAAGILILIMPRLLSYIVAIYLIFTGIMGLAHHLQ